VGVVGNVHDQGMDKPARTNVYWPALQANFWGHPLRAQRNATFVVRSSLAGSESLLKQARQAVWSVDGNLPLASVYTLNHLYTRSLAPVSFTLFMLGTAGAVALLLGAVGLYAVIAYSVAQRTREIGIRMALGAQRKNVVRLFLREGMSFIVIGLPVGLAGAFALTRLLSSLLFGVKANDPLTFVCAAVVLVLVAFAACQIPARRALRIDPMEALKSE
jgi:putative ABC transport system permease protein